MKTLFFIVSILISLTLFAQTESIEFKGNELTLSQRHIGYKRKITENYYFRSRLMNPLLAFNQNIPLNTYSYMNRLTQISVELDFGIERRKQIYKDGCLIFGISYSLQPLFESTYSDNPSLPMDERRVSDFTVYRHKMYFPLGVQYRFNWISLGFEYAPFLQYDRIMQEDPKTNIETVTQRQGYLLYDANFVITVHF